MIEWADIGSEREEKNYDEWAIEHSQGETSKEAISKTKRNLGVCAVVAVICGIEG